jgi:hypothetical protein
MAFLNGIVAVLALIVLSLTALVAWLYMQQSRIMQAVSALTAAITAPPASFYDAVHEYPIPEAEETEVETTVPVVPPEDDRVSVHEEEDGEEDEEEDDQPDDLGSKTIAQLRDILNGKGIPFNKSDKKSVLVNLLKAAS